ncbi:MAG TPA: hypothetical protein VFR07_00475 [Mycobacteriales bacterium]|nr:hypothetical protein [Mycobacteriales bacterium]
MSALAVRRADHVTAAAGQVRALLALRWQMTRTPGLRLAIVLGMLAAGWLLAVCLRSSAGLEPAVLETAVELAPQAYLGFGVLALIAPLTAGGGGEVVPADQLAAYPVRPAAQFLGGLLLAPLNLAWVVQLLVLAVETSCLTLGGSRTAGVVTTGAYAALATVVGQTLGWTAVGLRQTRAGRRALLGTGLALGALALLVVRAGAGGAVLDAAPTRLVVRAVVAGGAGDRVAWAGPTLALVLGTALMVGLGLRACAWALRRPGDAGATRSQDVRRRRPRPSVLRELVALDRASVWRAPALRRGGLVLALLPGLLAAGAQVPWASLVVLPGLVAAGAGLLFGINAFALDGSGALWLASLPVPPVLVARAKLLVLAETVLGAVVLSAVTGALRAPGTPTGAEVTAIVAAGLACTAVVVATGVRLSVRHPHRADLRGPRDAIAPPGALALAGVRLSVPAAFTGLVVGAAAAGNHWWLPPLVALPIAALAALSLRRSLRRWADPHVRGRVVQTVSAG